MSETSDYTPAHWAGHDFSSARSHYDDHAGRSYAKAVSENKTATDLIVEALSTNSPSPLLIAADVTGSMGEWPAVMFSKLPYLELEGQEYLGKNMEIAWLAVGDATSDKYPLQARPFTKGTDLKKRLEELVIEGGGGGQVKESYQLAAFYALHKADMPRAVHPILIMIGDEEPYDVVSVSEAKTAGVTLAKPASTEQVFVDLRKKMAVYLIRKPYEAVKDPTPPVDKGATNAWDMILEAKEDPFKGLGALDKRIHQTWSALIGDDHIAYLADPTRVVDVIFGILAKETGRFADFRKEIEERQTKAQVTTVYKALQSIHAGTPVGPPKVRAGLSTIHNPGAGKKSKGLL